MNEEQIERLIIEVHKVVENTGCLVFLTLGILFAYLAGCLPK